MPLSVSDVVNGTATSAQMQNVSDMDVGASALSRIRAIQSGAAGQDVARFHLQVLPQYRAPTQYMCRLAAVQPCSPLLAPVPTTITQPSLLLVVPSLVLPPLSTCPPPCPALPLITPPPPPAPTSADPVERAVLVCRCDWRICSAAPCLGATAELAQGERAAAAVATLAGMVFVCVGGCSVQQPRT